MAEGMGGAGMSGTMSRGFVGQPIGLVKFLLQELVWLKAEWLKAVLETCLWEESCI